MQWRKKEVDAQNKKEHKKDDSTNLIEHVYFILWMYSFNCRQA